MREFKIRGSGCGKIMGKCGLTDLQTAKLAELKTKQESGKITPNQLKELESLQYKFNNPKLPDTCISFLDQYVKEQLFNRTKQFTSKYTQKGLIVEDNSLDFIAEMLGLGMLIKNEVWFENDHMTGTPDVILRDCVIDVKNSWDCFTFPFFATECPDNDYYWQAQTYMALTNRQKYKLIYVLSDTPENIIYNEVKSYCYRNGIEDIEQELYDEFELKMTYKDIPKEHKIKVFEIDRNENDIAAIQKRVIECREYIKNNLTLQTNLITA